MDFKKIIIINSERKHDEDCKMKDHVISTKDLTKKFGDLVAVDGISLSIEKGELFGLLGPNGAGKTTLLKLLSGQLEPDEGKSNVLGIDPSKDAIGVKGNIGIVPEVESPPSFLTPMEYLQYVGLIRELKDIEKKAKHWIEYLDLQDVADVTGKDLSKGTKQRLMLGAAFIHQPRLLFLDEPFIGLDPYHQKKVKEYLSTYLSSGGTIFMCTHILEIAEKMCNRIAIIDHGRIVACGTLNELTQNNEGLDSAFLRLTGRISTD
jgi:ABC-2 type transport system ATP-binding protein